VRDHGNVWFLALADKGIDNLLHAYKIIATSNEVPVIPEVLQGDCQAAIRACFSRDVAKRPTAQQLRAYRWFSGAG
jgi:hypothetical protein